MKTDIQIARETPLKPIQEVASALDRALNDVRPYGFYAAQLPHTNIDLSSVNKNKLILAAAMMLTKAGIGKNAVLALQEPSLVPCFGMKGDGYTQILPMEDINLHFTGVFHAVTSAHNMISALVRYKVRI